VIREAFQDLNRLRQIATIAGRYGFGEMLDRAGDRAGVRMGASAAQTSAGAEGRTQTAAQRFRLVLSELGPTFVKLGQVLSTRADLLPAEFVEELAQLQDRVPSFELELVRQQVREGFGQELEELFADFSPEPMAAASIAQAHRARTRDGHEVVVKIQRPGVAAQLRSDISVLRYLARMLEAVVEEVAIYSPTGLIEEFDRAIHEELDFLSEAANIRAFHANHHARPDIKIPRVYDQLTTHSVLTLEFLDAPKLSDAQLDAGGRQKLATIILESAFQQLFEDGLFHGDPHPGNLLVLPGPVLALIDFGLVGRVSRQMQDTLISLVLAVALKDADSVAKLLYRMGTPDARANLMAFREDIDAVLGRYLPGTLQDIDARSLLRDLLNLAVKYRIRIPREYAILSRAAVTIEGTLRTLYPEMPIGQLFLPYAKRLLASRYDPSQLEGGVLKTMLRLQSAANELPIQLSQILLDLEAGKFTVTVRGDELQELNRNIRALAMVAFAGLLATGFIIGTFIAFAAHPWSLWGVPVMGLLGIAGTIFLFSTGVVRQTWGGFRKVSIKRFLRDGGR
jgi:ubiquinone biosynthesis protein